jgi:hypothetical protein
MYGKGSPQTPEQTGRGFFNDLPQNPLLTQCRSQSIVEGTMIQISIGKGLLYDSH